jgi:ubiquinol-cytochrome c reductase iron-sulfur subunit
VALVVGTLAALALAGVYIAGGQPQAEGALLFVALGSVGVALALWAKRLLPGGEVTEERGELGSTQEEVEEVEETFDEDGVPAVSRRRLLRLLAAAGGALVTGLAALGLRRR